MDNGTGNGNAAGQPGDGPVRRVRGAADPSPVIRRQRGDATSISPAATPSPAPSSGGGSKLAAVLGLAPWQVEPVVRREQAVALVNRGGVPKVFTDERLAAAIPDMLAHFSEGASLHEVAAFVGVPYHIIWKRCQQDPESDFATAVKTGTDLSCAWWKLQGRRSLGNPTFNLGLYVFQMANRFGWSRADRGEVGAGGDGGALTLSKTTTMSWDPTRMSTEELLTMRGLAAKALGAGNGGGEGGK